jgi:hypothetical protein
VTRRIKPGTRLDASAEELLESVSGLILREARQAAAQRTGDDNRVSSVDILDVLERQLKRGRWKDRTAFAAQVILTAVAIAATATSFAAVRLTVGIANPDKNGAVSSITSFFTTVMLATLLIVAAAVLVAVLRESKEDQRRTSKVRQAGSSRREDRRALLSEWLDFEQFMRRQLYVDPSNAPVHELSSDILRFAQVYDLDSDEIRSVLRVRNAIAHDERVSAPDVQESLRRLRLLRQKLSPIQLVSVKYPGEVA